MESPSFCTQMCFERVLVSIVVIRIVSFSSVLGLQVVGYLRTYLTPDRYVTS